MKISISGKELELDNNLQPIVLVLIGIGVALVPIGEFVGNWDLRVGFYNLMLLSILVSIITLSLYRVKSQLGEGFLLISLSVLVLMARIWLGFNGLLTLLVIPVALAMLLLGASGLFVTAVGNTVILTVSQFWLPGRFSWPEIITALIVIWGLAVVDYLIYRQVYSFCSWSIRYWEQGQEVYLNAQQNQYNLEKALQNLSAANQLLLKANKRADQLRAFAETAEKTKAMFVARVSHEFRTPLNMIIGLVELMVDSPQIYAIRMPPDLEKDLEVVLRNCRHLATMIDDVLELTRAESGNLVLHRSWVDLLEIVSEARVVVSPLIKKKGLNLAVTLPDDLPTVYCDRTRIRQVILNLVSNAARFTEHGGIHIQIEKSEELIIASVTDTGPGITPEDARRIFEPFCQGSSENSWKERGGSGLGLTISKQFVELHGGQMWLKSQPGQGSIFYFTLPISERASYQTRPERWIQSDWVWHEESFRAARLDDAAKQSRPRVLVYDQTGGLVPELERYSDTFEIVPVTLSNGDSAPVVDAADGSSADFIWVNMDSLDRNFAPVVEVCRMYPGAPAVASAFLPVEEQHKALSILRYLTKPITMEKLKQSINEIAPQARSVLVVDDNEEVQDLLRRMLNLILPEGSVTCLSNGAQAIALLDETPVDLLLLDAFMPGVNGWEVLDHLRSRASTQSLPVLVISAQDLSERPALSTFYTIFKSEGLTVKRLLDCSMLLMNLQNPNVAKPGSALPQTVES